jgi:molecular chaperone Hsp33
VSAASPVAPPGGEPDRVLPFAVEGLDVRGRVVRLGPALDAMLRRHAYPEPVSRLLGEAVALTALLGTSLKFSGRFILQTSSDGPVDLLVVDFTTPDGLRAYARFDADRVAAAGRVDAAVLLGTGHLAMTVDQGPHTSRYQGIVALDGASLEEIAHRYFLQSEQIPTRVRLAVAEVVSRQPGEAPRREWRAGGILVQFLPEATDRITHRDLAPGDAPHDDDLRRTEDVLDDDASTDASEDDAWVEARALVDTVEDVELTDPEVTAERLLVRLFHERGVRVFSERLLADRCRCSRRRVAGMLAGFEPEERADMTREDGSIEVTCEFCSTRYVFAAEEVADLGAAVSDDDG